MEHICGYNGNMTRFLPYKFIGIDKKTDNGTFCRCK